MSAADYRRLIQAARREQLRRTAENVQRLDALYLEVAKSLTRRLRQAPEDTLTREYLESLLRDVNRLLADLRADVQTQLAFGMLETAQAAADAQGKAAEIVGAAEDRRLVPTFNRVATLSGGAELSVSFGRVAVTAVERIAARVYRDGLSLSTRLYNLDRATRRAIEDTVVQGVAEQVSARKLAKRLVTSLTAAGADNPRYQALRIARTEIRNAHTEAHLQSVLEPSTGRLKEFLVGVRFTLSASHKDADMCDVWASADRYDLGPGIYPPEAFPVSHPQCLCFGVSVLKAFPEVGRSKNRPKPDEVPESLLRQYANQGDEAAQRLLEERQQRAA